MDDTRLESQERQRRAEHFATIKTDDGRVEDLDKDPKVADVLNGSGSKAQCPGRVAANGLVMLRSG